MALLAREHEAYELEETRFFGPNVLAFRLITAGAKFYVVGCYFQLSDLKSLDQAIEAHKQCPKGFELLLLGDFNINLDTPRNTRDERIAEQCDYWNLVDMSTQFTQQQTRRIKGRWIWRQPRLGRWVVSHLDYFMGSPRTRKMIRKVRLRKLRHHNTDHRATIATFWGGG